MFARLVLEAPAAGEALVGPVRMHAVALPVRLRRGPSPFGSRSRQAGELAELVGVDEQIAKLRIERRCRPS